MLKFRHQRTLLATCLIAAISLWFGAGALTAAPEVKLTAWIYNNPGWLDYHKQAFAEYERMHPNVKIEMIPGTADSLIVALAGGVQVDLLYEASARFTAPAAAGLFQDLKPIIDRDTTFNLSRYFPNAVQGYYRDVALFGMPQTVSPALLFCNRSLLEQAGAVIPSAWNWQEFIGVAKKLTRDLNNDGVVEQFGYAYENWSHYNRWPIYVWQNGGEIFSPDLRKVIIDQPAAIEGLQFMKDLASVYGVAALPGNPALPANNYTKAFEANLAGMLPSTRFYNPPQAMDVSLAHLPSGKTRATSLISNYYSILTGSKHTDEVWRLIRYLLEQSTRKGVIDKFTQALPSYIPNARDLILDHPKAAEQMFWIDGMNYARTPYTPPLPSWQAINNQYLNQMASGAITVAAAAEGITREANALLNEYYAKK